MQLKSRPKFSYIPAQGRSSVLKAVGKAKELSSTIRFELLY